MQSQPGLKEWEQQSNAEGAGQHHFSSKRPNPEISSAPSGYQGSSSGQSTTKKRGGKGVNSGSNQNNLLSGLYRVFFKTEETEGTTPSVRPHQVEQTAKKSKVSGGASPN